MSKRTVIITFTIDTDEYDDWNGKEPSAKEVLDLAAAMITGDADLPRDVSLSCENETFSLDDALGEGNIASW